MLSNNDLIATVAVSDMARARDFYENTLGLKLKYEFEGGISYETGKTGLFVYESKFAGTNKATAAGWMVDDVAAVVEELKAKGVTFEHYDFPGTTMEGDIHVMGEMRVVWFKDPDGNIFSVTNDMTK